MKKKVKLTIERTSPFNSVEDFFQIVARQIGYDPQAVMYYNGTKLYIGLYHYLKLLDILTKKGISGIEAEKFIKANGIRVSSAIAPDSVLVEDGFVILAS